jgi:uncharacterized protein YecE (DUF72 family)
MQSPLPYYVGLAQWHHPDWYPDQLHPSEALETYAQHFSSVEGNSSFYGLPSEKSIAQWQERTPSQFRFCFKFPQSITHQALLQDSDRPLEEFLNRVAPLQERLGVLWLQMSSQFSPIHLPQLAHFLERLPKAFTYGIELRHLDFFKKDHNEQALNRLLIEHGVNRVCFDTRSLFAYPKDDKITQEALKAKPRMPVHVLATGNAPLVRFITPLDRSLGEPYLTPWVKKCADWILEGRTPYLFFHTPDNKEAPELALLFIQQLNEALVQSGQYEAASLPLPTLWEKDSRQNALF